MYGSNKIITNDQGTGTKKNKNRRVLSRSKSTRAQTTDINKKIKPPRYENNVRGGSGGVLVNSSFCRNITIFCLSKKKTKTKNQLFTVRSRPSKSNGGPAAVIRVAELRTTAEVIPMTAVIIPTTAAVIPTTIVRAHRNGNNELSYRTTENTPAPVCRYYKCTRETRDAMFRYWRRRGGREVNAPR